MGLTDILSTSTLICLGIMLLLVGAVGMFFMQKMNEQNHKIASMLGLVSTMAEELNFVRSRVQILSSNTFAQAGGSAPVTGSFAESDNNLIEVSDNEEDEDEDASEDISASEADDDDDDDDETSDDEDAETDGEDSDEEDDGKQNIKTINMGETLEASFHCEALEEDINEAEAAELEESTSSNSELDDDLESVNDENLDEVGFENAYAETLTLTNTEFIKSIDISSLEESQKDSETYDYKKMSLNKLRSVVVEKGLVTDSSKLKKNELLKLLSSE